MTKTGACSEEQKTGGQEGRMSSQLKQCHPELVSAQMPRGIESKPIALILSQRGGGAIRVL